MAQVIENSVNIKPFLRWAGSKQRLLQEIFSYFPNSFNNYHEPFLGSASVFLLLNCPKKAYLYDLNSELVNTYVQLRDNLDEVIFYLKKFNNTEVDYYKIRDQQFKIDSKKAAQFIYLNKTCFNGLYRVNPNNGKFNVPYGHRKNVDLITSDNLESVSLKLKNTVIKAQDFKLSLKHIKKNDLVFLDPPYTVAHENNGFVEYNQKIFSWEDQVRLKEFVTEVQNKDAYFVLTNAAHLSIKQLYANIAKPIIVERNSLIGGKNAFRGRVNEYIITNYVKS